MAERSGKPDGQVASVVATSRATGKRAAVASKTPKAKRQSTVSETSSSKKRTSSTRSTAARASHGKGANKPKVYQVLVVFPPDIYEDKRRRQDTEKWLNRVGFVKPDFAIHMAKWPESWEGQPHGPQRIGQLIEQQKQIFALLSQHKPTVLIFMSSVMWEAFLQIEELLKAKGKALWDVPLNAGVRMCDIKLKTLFQHRENSVVIGLPVPSRRLSAQDQQTITEALTTFLSAH